MTAAARPVLGSLAGRLTDTETAKRAAARHDAGLTTTDDTIDSTIAEVYEMLGAVGGPVQIALPGPQNEPTDVGNAARFVAAYGPLFRWVPPWGVWLKWDGRRWARDDRGEHVEAAKDVTRMMLDNARALPDGDERRRAVRFALAAESAPRIKAMLELARSAPGVTVMPDELDADPWVLNVANGMIDLRNGWLHDHDPSALLTKLAPFEYHPPPDEIPAPTWEEFLDTILPDPDVREFVARALGYSITGTTGEQVLLIPHGAGANGKTTMLEAVRHVLGDYASTAEPDLLLARRDAHPTGLADLHGARFVTCSESDDGRRFAEATVKRLTGSDTVKARRMHRDFFEFAPSHKLWLATNHRPDVRGTDHAIWRRLRLIPFTVTIPDTQQDPELPRKLAAEAEGILFWLVDACLRWYTEGLTEPASVILANASYRAEQDRIGGFLDECTECDEAHAVAAGDLFDAYVSWAKSNGEEYVSQKRFGASLTERGFDRAKVGTHRRWHWIALRLLNSIDVNP